MKTTFKDIAIAAGVGSATVERVLNGRGGVKPETVEKVLVAARSLDYPKRLPERHRGVIRIEVVLVRPDTAFFARFSRAFERIVATLPASVSLHRTFVDEADAAAIAARLLKPGARRSGLILAVPQYAVVAAALEDLLGQGLPVVQVVSGMDRPDVQFVGIDNAAAGRVAGQLMAGMAEREGTVMALWHSNVYSIHRQRIEGFRDAFQRHGRGGLKFEDVAATHDDPLQAVGALNEALRRYPDLVGLYNAGGGNEALCSALRRSGKKNLFFIGHELNEATTAGLRDGTMDVVIDQAPEAMARRAVDLMLGRLGLIEELPENPPIRFVTITAENV